MTDNKKAQRLSKEERKNKIIGFDDYRSNCRIKNKEAKKIQDPKKAADIIKRYEDNIKTKNKGIVNVAYHQGQVFKKSKEKEKFVKLVSELGIHKTTIIFRITVFKLCKKHPQTIEVFHRVRVFLRIIIRALKQFAKNMKNIFNSERFYLLKLSCHVSLH